MEPLDTVATSFVNAVKDTDELEKASVGNTPNEKIIEF